MENLKIYLDNCCFNRPYDDQNKLRIELETKAKLFIQKQIIKNRVDLVISYVVELENRDNPFLIRKTAIEDFFKYATENIEESEELLVIANDIKKNGLKTKDSLHIACAIIARCDYLLTTDDRLLKYRNSKIKIINPANFILIEEKFNHE